MQLRNRFTVDVPLAQAWPVLRDLEQVAPHVPGAELESVNGDELRGTLRVKVGSVAAKYEGNVTLGERDDDAHTLLIKGIGRDAGGRGNGVASLSVSASDEGSATAVDLTLELTLTGKFSRLAAEVMSGAADELLEEFTASLAGALPEPASTPAPEPAHAPEPEPEPAPEPAPAPAPTSSPLPPPAPVLVPKPEIVAESQPEPEPVPALVPAPTADGEAPASTSPSWARDLSTPTPAAPRATNQLAALLAALGVAGLFLAWLARRRRRS